MLTFLPRRLAITMGAVVCLGCAAELGPIPDGARQLTDGQVLKIDATVRFMEIEGGCWVLATADGRYEPVDLPASFRVDGKAVRVRLRAASELVTICMTGPLVHVDSISARP